MSFNQLPPSGENYMQRDIDSRATGVTIKKTPKNGSYTHTQTHTDIWGTFIFQGKPQPN